MPQLEQSEFFVSQVFWLLVTFAVIYFYIARVISPRLTETLNKRTDSISRDLAIATENKNNAREAEVRLMADLDKVKSQANKLIESAKRESEKSYSEQLEKVEQEIKQRIKNAEVDINSKREEVRKELDAELVVYASDIVKKIVGVEMNKSVFEQVKG